MPPKHRGQQAKATPAPAVPTKYRGGKFIPRPPAPVSERLPKLYRALADQVNDGYFDNAKKTCKKILALDAASTSAFQTLLFLHLHTDDYTSALALVAEHETPTSPLAFERAYCLYRLHREPEALSLLTSLPTLGRQEKHLQAQVLYRLGKYEDAQAVYDELLASAPAGSSEAEDIRTNMGATKGHVAFVKDEYKAQLGAQAVENPASGVKAYTPTSGEVESYVPSVPAGWANAASPAAGSKPAASTSKAAPVVETKPRTKPRHRLPKGAVAGKPFTQDPDRWLPLKQRASYAAAQAGGPGKKGKKEVTGLGTQGATGGGGSGGGGGGGGGNKKKGKKK